MSDQWKEISASEAQARADSARRHLADIEEQISIQEALCKEEPGSFAYRLSLQSLNAQREELERQLGEVLHYRVKEVIGLSLRGTAFYDNTANISDLAHILSRVQDLFSGVLQAISTGPTERGPLPSRILELSNLRLSSVYPSSFGMSFEVKTVVDMFGHSDVLDALDVVFSLLQAEHNKDKLIDFAGHLGRRAIRRYRNLVEILIETEASAQVQWDDPFGQPHKWQGSTDNFILLAHVLGSLRSETKSVESVPGWLLGASLLRNTFEFVTDKDVLIRGRIARDSRDRVREYFGKACVIEFQTTIVSDEITGTVRESNVLTGIGDAET